LKTKFLIVALVTSATLTIHYYDIIFANALGHSHLMHAIHGRLCYIPIVLSAFWFGIRGGLITALVISYFSIVYIYVRPITAPQELYSEFAEIAFYFAIGGFSGILLDSERSSRRKKEEAEKRLAHAERLSLVGQMVASIAHEIKNPLGSIKGAVQILKDGTTPEPDRTEFTSIIEKEVNRLDGVVQDYLSFSKPSPLKMNEINISDIITEVIKQMKYQCDQTRVKVSFDSGAMPVISGDRNRLHQLFLNMFLNSLQAMPDGGEIRINCDVRQKENGGYLDVKFSDSGRGITSENIERIFEPFFSTKTQGTGLGLATAKVIVAEHNGSIRVESTIGKGTSFQLQFPLIRGAQS